MTLEEQAIKLTPAEIVSVLSAKNFLDEQVKTLQSRLERVESQLAWFKKQLFGQKSEQRKYLGSDSRQLFFGELFEAKKEETATPVIIKEHQRGKNCKKEVIGTPEDSGLRFLEGEVPMEVVELPCPELEGEDKEQYEVVSTDSSYKLAQKPGSYVVIKYVKTTVKHRQTKKLTTTRMPDSVLGKSVADVSLLAGMQIDKCLYYLPLYRQHQRLKDVGITISRASLSSMFHASVSLLEPIFESQLKSIRSGSLVWMDETPIKAGRVGPGKMRESRIWPIMGEQGEVCFVWKESREHKHVGEILGEKFSGVLLSDGYAAYERYAEKNSDVLSAQCWNHTRRKFVEAKEAEPELADIALDHIGKLYLIEREIRKKDLQEEKKLKFRLDHSKPKVEEFFDWLQSTSLNKILLPSSPFTEAMSYALKRETELKVFLRFPEVPLDTNDLEREQRCIALGRNNWHFCWTEIGAKYLGITQSLIRTCILQHIDPWKYLVDVLQRVGSHPRSQIQLLTPRLWKTNFEQIRFKSILEKLREAA